MVLLYLNRKFFCLSSKNPLQYQPFWRALNMSFQSNPNYHDSLAYFIGKFILHELVLTYSEEILQGKYESNGEVLNLNKSFGVAISGVLEMSEFFWEREAIFEEDKENLLSPENHGKWLKRQTRFRKLWEDVLELLLWNPVFLSNSKISIPHIQSLMDSVDGVVSTMDQLVLNFVKLNARSNGIYIKC